METLLYRWDKIKKDEHGKHFQDKRKHVSPFVISVDGMIGRKALVVLANLSRLMTVKMDEPISHVKVCINSLISIAVPRS